LEGSLFRIIDVDTKRSSVLVSRRISIFVLIFDSSFYILFGKAVADQMYPSFLSLSGWQAVHKACIKQRRDVMHPDR
jgi:hypothetical protein